MLIAWEPDDRYYYGYWDLAPDGPAQVLEQMPESPDLQTVLDWGRARARRVSIRPQFDHAQYYWASLEEPEHEEEARMPRLDKHGQAVDRQ